MNEARKTVNRYLGDLIAVHRHCLGAMDQQCESAAVKADAGSFDLITRSRNLLRSHQAALEARLAACGGSADAKEAVTSVTGFLAGLYDRMRSETASRILRDNFTALHFLYACQTMLIATAHASGDATTASLVREQQQGLPPLLLEVTQQLPAAVVGDLHGGSAAPPGTASVEFARDSARDAWRHADTRPAYTNA